MEVAKLMGARYMECSSKEMVGVQEIFAMAIDVVIANDKSNQQGQKLKSNSPDQQHVVMKKKKRECRFL